MPRKKQVVEKRLTNQELDRQLSLVKFRSKKGKAIFDEISKETWFRQYARGSNAASKKIIAKVKKGINHGKYSYISTGELEEVRGSNEKSKGLKKLQKEIKKVNKKQKQVSRKQREKIKLQERRAPSGRKYSSVEIHEGKNSKRAKAWRKKNGISEKDV